MSCINVALLTVTLLSARGVMLRDQRQLKGETCSTLENQGSYFSVPVCVGTPAQCFDAIPDTGSDAVIVPSCACNESPGTGCRPSDKCFRGTNKSSTFSIPKHPRFMAITFGDGKIGVVAASDVVAVADFKVTMEDGVLLMVDRSKLKVAGPFEGLLGLGLPKDWAALASMLQGPVHAGQYASKDKDQSDQLRVICSLMPRLCDDLSREGMPGGGVYSKQYEPKLFLEQAKVDRFSLCFRDSGQTGAFRLGLSPFASPIQNVGTFHWALDFQGVSVGARGASAPTETLFCGPETMKQGMKTPCAIVPDSGATLLVGPKEQVSSLEAGICSKWERCQKHSKGMPSSEAFRKLLWKCDDWLTEEKGLLEIPSLFFHVKSGDGKPEAFELTAWAWVTKMSMPGPFGSIMKACTSGIEVHPALSTATQINGHIWIFGGPLFHEYNVGYDMSTKQISLQKGRCEACSADGGPVSFGDDGGRRWPRAAHGEPRIPDYNVNLPL